MKLGAHLSVAGGYHNALNKIVSIGGNCLQIFLASPRGWHTVQPSIESIENFLQLKKNVNIDPIYFHASYLINLANTERVGELSKNLLIHELQTASEMGIKGSIIHLGSYKETNTDNLFNDKNPRYETLVHNIKTILTHTPSDTLFIIENAGNRKIGLKLEEIAEIIRDVNDNRVRVCLDTCHLHAAGYDLSTTENLTLFFQAFNNLIGIERLEVIHCNDSKDPLGSFRDRHENIGQGTIGIETFKLLINYPLLKNTPFIIETPGFDDKGPDKQNIDILKGLIL